MKLLLDTNNIDCLPDEVREKYEITDCYVYIDLTKDLVNKWIDTVISTIRDIELREKDYAETNSDKCFWDDEDSVKAQSYYYANLCSYSANKLRPYKEYLDKLEEMQNGLDLFSGVGTNIENEVSDAIPLRNKKSEIDLSWLDNL